MLLKKIDNDWYLLSEEEIKRGNFFYCSIDNKVHCSSMNNIGEGWTKTSKKIIASSLKKQGLPLINVPDLEIKIAELKKKNSEPISEEEQESIEVFCIKATLEKNKWSHLSYNVKRPYPVFFWNEVDDMIKEIKKYSHSEIEITEFDVEFEMEYGFVKITSLKLKNELD